MSTVSVKPADVKRAWYLVDAENLILGRISTRIATVLMGKHKPTFTPHVDTGDFVVVVNCEKVKLTGRKLDTQKYYRYSGYQSGLKVTTAREMLATKPEMLIHEAVRRMLPKNKLARQQIKKLKIYAGADHPHNAQSPQPFPTYV
jgi:large subunit ribosomal protein L13